MHDFLREKQRLDYSGSTCDLFQRWLLDFQEFCREHGAPQLGLVAPGHVAAYQRRLTWEPNRRGHLNTPNTVDQALRMVRAFCRWCQSRGLLRDDPTGYLVLGRPVQPVRTLISSDELRRLLEVPDRSTALGLRDRLLLILVAAIDLGLAGCEQLTVADRPELDSHLEPDFLAYLRSGRPELARQHSGQALLLVRDGAPMAAATMALRIGQLGRLAGLPKLSARRLRQSYRAQFQARGLQLTFPL